MPHHYFVHARKPGPRLPGHHLPVSPGERRGVGILHRAGKVLFHQLPVPLESAGGQDRSPPGGDTEPAALGRGFHPPATLPPGMIRRRALVLVSGRTPASRQPFKKPGDQSRAHGLLPGQAAFEHSRGQAQLLLQRGHAAGGADGELKRLAQGHRCGGVRAFKQQAAPAAQNPAGFKGRGSTLPPHGLASGLFGEGIRRHGEPELQGRVLLHRNATSPEPPGQRPSSEPRHLVPACRFACR